MSDSPAAHRTARRRTGWSTAAIALTALLCGVALLYRAPLRAHYWAWQLTRATTPDEQRRYLNSLCQAGPEARRPLCRLAQHDAPVMRQYALLALQGRGDGWARDLLLAALRDSDAEVRHTAAIGLAARGDCAAVPPLMTIIAGGTAEDAGPAWSALRHLPCDATYAALRDLVGHPGDILRQAALVDTLTALGGPGAIPPLLELLDDDRPCPFAPWDAGVAPRLAEALAALGYPGTTSPPGAPAGTVAERAAAGLNRITGLAVSFSSADPPEARDRAREAWARWQPREQDNP